MTSETYNVVTITGCPWCSLVKKELRTRNLPFTTSLLSTQEEKDAFKEANGVTTFPQVFAIPAATAGAFALPRKIGGHDDTMAYLKEKGL